MPPITDNTSKYEKQVSLPQVPLELRHLIKEEEWSSLTYEQRNILSNLESMPPTISGVMSDEIWSTLSLKQRLEILISYEMLPSVSFEGDGISTAIEIPESIIDESAEDQHNNESVEIGFMQGTVEVEDPTRSEFEEAKERMREIESSVETEETEDEIDGAVAEITTLPSEQEVEEPTFNVPSVPKFTGYQPSKDLLQDIEVEVNGSPTKARTWTANIINKIWLALSPQDD